METLTNQNYKNSNLDLVLLNGIDAAVYQVQQIYNDIKYQEAEKCIDEDVKTRNDYINKYPEIFLTAYNHNDKIEIEITQNNWQIRVKDFEDYQTLTNEDLIKAKKEIDYFVGENS